MTIQSVLTKLDTSMHPVAQVLHKGNDSKALIIGFKKGMELKDHSAKIASKLLVIKGQIMFRDTISEVELKQYEEVAIPANEVHHVTALTDSLCILIQG